MPIAAFGAPGLLVNGVEALTRDLQVGGDGIEQAAEEIHGFAGAYHPIAPVGCLR